MDASGCDECKAIYQELREAYRAAAHNGDCRHTPLRLAEWVEQLGDEDRGRMRETSVLWKPWRRWQRHRTLTGHILSVLPVPPRALSNPN